MSGDLEPDYWTTGLLHVHVEWLGGDPVRDNFELARAFLLLGRHLEGGRDEAVEGDRHAAVVMGAAVEDVPGRVIRDPNDRIVRGGLSIVAVSGSLRHAVEEMSGDLVRPAGSHGRR